ncbi:hypothetical protein L1887_03368 [Cichorium endivia]|nr:hypothetical protein L1887_03368 [Cichorium endivia]
MCCRHHQIAVASHRFVPATLQRPALVGHGVLLLDCEGLAESVSLGKERVNLFSLYVLLYSTLIHHQLFSGHIRTKSSSDLSFLQRFGLAVRASEPTSGPPALSSLLDICSFLADTGNAIQSVYKEVHTRNVSGVSLHLSGTTLGQKQGPYFAKKIWLFDKRVHGATRIMDYILRETKVKPEPMYSSDSSYESVAEAVDVEAAVREYLPSFNRKLVTSTSPTSVADSSEESERHVGSDLLMPILLAYGQSNLKDYVHG